MFLKLVWFQLITVSRADYISSNNGTHPVTKTFTTLHYTSPNYTSLHFTPLVDTSLLSI